MSRLVGSLPWQRQSLFHTCSDLSECWKFLLGLSLVLCLAVHVALTLFSRLAVHVAFTSYGHVLSRPLGLWGLCLVGDGVMLYV